MSPQHTQPEDHWSQPTTPLPAVAQPPADPRVVRVPVAKSPAQTEDPSSLAAITIPGDSVDLEKRVESVSPEGPPADPHSGPGGQLLLLSVILLGIVALAILAGWMYGWGAAIVAILLGMLSLVFNPAVLAIFQRAGDRRKVMNQLHVGGHDVPVSGTRVVRGDAPPQV